MNICVNNHKSYNIGNCKMHIDLKKHTDNSYLFIKIQPLDPPFHVLYRIIYQAEIHNVWEIKITKYVKISNKYQDPKKWI